MASVKKSAFLPQLVLATLGLLMVAVSVYLTNHYYEVIFPTDLRVGSFCDISRFWNCDSAAFSPLGTIFNVPTSLFGIAVGLIILLGSFTRKVPLLETNYFVAIVNLISCIVLFCYSIFFLGGLCPGCTIYYILSLAVVLVFFRRRLLPIPRVSLLAIYAFLVAMMMAVTYFYNHQRFQQQDASLSKWIESFKHEPIIDDKGLDFSLPIMKSTENFGDAPLRVTVFSDFECPFCKLLSNQLERAAARFAGKINIRYVFFPLSSSCNDRVKSDAHPHACSAARLSYCARDRFVDVHDDIYDHQESLTDQWLLEKALKLGVKDCYTNPETNKVIKRMVDTTDAFPIDGVPMLLVNEKKLSGLIPQRALIALFEALLQKHAQ